MFRVWCLKSQVKIMVKHIFSVEFDETKRRFIMDAHRKPGSKGSFHMFDDVSILIPAVVMSITAIHAAASTPFPLVAMSCALVPLAKTSALRNLIGASMRLVSCLPKGAKLDVFMHAPASVSPNVYIDIYIYYLSVSVIIFMYTCV